MNTGTQVSENVAARIQKTRLRSARDNGQAPGSALTPRAG
jgi:hypothetical protein